MKLFASLYLDEDVSVLVGVLLAARGFDVLTTREAGNLGRDDSAQLNFAVSSERCFVTHNRVHFEQLHREFLQQGRKHYGIAIPAQRNPNEIVRRIAALLDALTADEIAGQLLYV